MELIVKALGGLILLLLFYSLLGLILPEGSLARYVRLVMGLALLASLVTSLGGRGAEWDMPLAAEPAPAAAMGQWRQQGQEQVALGQQIAAGLTADARASLERELASQMQELIQPLTGAGVERVILEQDGYGGVAELTLMLDTELGEAEDEVKELICREYQLNEEQVRCVTGSG